MKLPELVESVGVFGAIAVGLLLFYAVTTQSVQYPVSLLNGQFFILTWPVLLAAALLIGQFKRNREEASNNLKAAVAEAKAQAEFEVREAAKKREVAEAVERADRQFWNDLNASLTDRRALMDHDAPDYVSAVVDSAHLLRDSISRALSSYPDISEPMQIYSRILRDEVKEFLDNVQLIETRANTRLKGAGIDRWKLEELCKAQHDKEMKSVPYESHCGAAFEDAHDQWRKRTQTLTSIAAKLLGRSGPDFHR
ncbi:hypothetical protein FJ976_19255 [Mesorhizobium sp. B1-1-9]|uniref:hypothetical protein n=1 Tax=Mesorhizobium sp. B1-1-9 TaxID=2589975 RepID=UPI00112BAE7C|nr:hypothetical protein [Mesorhizobium sp. B1-1-9]TPN48539.1 hypothetical protein FJ976_19255 [Mesorhizobium sp. B1-1-9]